MKPTLLVLAAGMGSRYGGNKQLDEVGPSGETIIDYSIYDAIRAGFGKIVFVIRHDIEEQVKERFVDKLAGKIEIDYVFQEITNLPEGVKVSLIVRSHGAQAMLFWLLKRKFMNLSE